MENDRVSVVIVEDEPDTAEMFAEMMRLEGYRVHKSYNGEAAKKQIEKNIPDVVVLDIVMPNLSGLDVLKWMRGHEKLKNISVILVSARSLPADVAAVLNDGYTEYLTKPVAFEDLRSAITKMLN